MLKNPGILVENPEYIDAIKDLSVEIQVSMAFWRDETAKRVEPEAPLISERRLAVEELVNETLTESCLLLLSATPRFPHPSSGWRRGRPSWEHPAFESFRG